MDKLKMHSVDGVAQNVERIAELFPNCVTESRGENGELKYAVDFDKLKIELSEVVEGNEERYQFTWPGKREAIRLANSPIAAALRPVREESVDFDNTQNLYIEGDNLDVLKLLRETYLGKVKMIYIDPPYNTGNDFVYEDDFSQAADEYLAKSGQFDDQGNRLVSNTESNGRFHTDWLNMIYPRLKVARDLLSEDGAIFISIDDNEVENLKKVCTEVFGEKNFVSQIINVNNIAGRSDSKHIATSHEYVLMYQKTDCLKTNGLPLSEEQKAEYRFEDERGLYRLQGLRKRGSGARREDRPNMYYPIYYNPTSEEISLNMSEDAIEIYPKLSDGADGRWRWGKETFNSKKDFIEVKIVQGRNEYDVYEKVYLESEDGSEKTTKMKSFLLDASFTSDSATTAYRDIMPAKSFDSPKSPSFIQQLVHVGSQNDSLILDFFSGSATTAHAVMRINAEDGGCRKFIMVQLPEKTDEDSDARRAGFTNICEIGKARICRAGDKIKEEAGLMAQNLDIGFRVLRLDSSNMEDVYYTPDKFDPSAITGLLDNVKPDRSDEDLLFQVMLELDIPLSASIKKEQLAGKHVFNVADGHLIATFDKDVNETTVTEIAKQRPNYFVMRDASAANDNVLDNFEQIFRHYSPDTICKIL